MSKIRWFDDFIDLMRTKVDINEPISDEEMRLLKDTLIQTYLYNHTFLNDVDRNLAKRFEPLESLNKYLFDWWDNSPSNEQAIACFKFFAEHWKLIDWCHTGWIENEKADHPLGIYHSMSLCCPPDNI